MPDLLLHLTLYIFFILATAIFMFHFREELSRSEKVILGITIALCLVAIFLGA